MLPLFSLLSCQEQQLKWIQHNYAASAWAVMERMGSVLVPDELNGPDIHRLENVMTLETGIHTLFDNLKLWLDADVSKIDYRQQNETDTTASLTYNTNIICAPQIMLYIFKIYRKPLLSLRPLHTLPCPIHVT